MALLNPATAAPLVGLGPVGWGVIAILAVGTVYMASQSNTAGRVADSTLADTQADTLCATCCGPLNDEIKALRDELEGRHRDMRIDNYDLFNQARSTANPMFIDGVKIGSWDGHVQQFEDKQRRLRRKIAEARENDCPIDTPDADRWGSIDPPSRPG